MPELHEVIAALARNVTWSQHSPGDSEIVQEWLEENVPVAEQAGSPQTGPKTKKGA